MKLAIKLEPNSSN